MKRTCLTCRHWSPPPEIRSAATGDSFAQCRRFPPVPNLAESVVRGLLHMLDPDQAKDDATSAAMDCNSSLWPEVYADQWCGEWQPLEGEKT